MKTRHATWAALLLLMAMYCATARAGGAIPVRLELLTPSTLSLDLGELREAPIRVRVLRQSDNMPLGGVAVQFFVNATICMPAPGVSCTPTPPGLHGAFVPAPGGSPGTIVRISNGQGEAVSTSFRAGTVPGVYPLAAIVFGSSGHDSGGAEQVQVLQGGALPLLVFPPDPSAALIPVDGRGGQLALYLLILLGAAWSMRRRQ